MYAPPPMCLTLVIFNMLINLVSHLDLRFVLFVLIQVLQKENVVMTSLVVLRYTLRYIFG